MKNVPLGRLERLDVRQYWKSEPYDFTPWLALPENLQLLGDTIGMELELEAQEQNVGPYRADIVCRDTAINTTVLIENQLEKTDHTHLGQLMTYASGLNAVTIVWIANRFTDEHRAALDWLNEITDESINFFGLEIELWRIGESAIAPKFNMVSKPNEWTRSVAHVRKDALSQIQQLQLSFWSGLREYLLEMGSNLKPQKPSPSHWAAFSIGRSNFQLFASIYIREQRMGAGLLIYDPDSTAYFQLLAQQKEQIELETESELEWRELPEKKNSEIGWYVEGVDLRDHTTYPILFAQLRDMLERLHSIFSGRIRSLRLDNPVE